MVFELHSKQAIAMTTFSWIFMTIVGGVLIMFTYSILQGYWAIEEENTNLEFTKALTNSLEIKAQSLGVQSATIVDSFPIMSQKNIQMQCIESEFLRLELEGETLNYEPLNEFLDSHSIFMPPLDDEESLGLYLIQEDFNFPMSITAFIGIVPKHHIMILHKNSDIATVVERLVETKKSYKQLSFLIYDETTTDPQSFLDELSTYNPSSITFVNFPNQFIIDSIITRYNTVNYDVYHLEIEFLRTPSYISSSNSNKEVFGTLQYTYSNNENDFYITNQNDNAQPPREFNFFGVNDETSLPLFSLFTSPNVFSCSYDSLIEQTESHYTYSKEKIKLITTSQSGYNPLIDLTSTYCTSSITSQTLIDFYEIILNNLEGLYTNTNTNFFKNGNFVSTMGQIQTIEEAHKELQRNSCELLY